MGIIILKECLELFIQSSMHVHLYNNVRVYMYMLSRCIYMYGCVLVPHCLHDAS